MPGRSLRSWRYPNRATHTYCHRASVPRCIEANRWWRSHWRLRCQLSFLRQRSCWTRCHRSRSPSCSRGGARRGVHGGNSLRLVGLRLAGAGPKDAEGQPDERSETNQRRSACFHRVMSCRLGKVSHRRARRQCFRVGCWHRRAEGMGARAPATRTQLARWKHNQVPQMHQRALTDPSWFAGMGPSVVVKFPSTTEAVALILEWRHALASESVFSQLIYGQLGSRNEPRVAASLLPKDCVRELLCRTRSCGPHARHWPTRSGELCHARSELGGHRV